MAKLDPAIWEWTGKRHRYVGSTDARDRRVTVYASPRLIAEFAMNRKGIAKIAVGEELQDATRSVVVDRAMPYAIRISPHGDTLDYLSSWRAADGFTVVAGMRRAAAKLVNVSGHAAAVEWVSKRGHGRGYGVLRRTLAHLNATSPIGVERAQRAAARAPWKAELHPRGPKGRFVRAPRRDLDAPTGAGVREQMRGAAARHRPGG